MEVARKSRRVVWESVRSALLVAVACLVALAAVELSTLGDFQHEATKPPRVPDVQTPSIGPPGVLVALGLATWVACATARRRRG